MQDRITAAVPGIASIHHVHVWGLTLQRVMLTMHVCVSGRQGDEPALIVRQVKKILQEEFGIDHSTIEVEHEVCADESPAGC
jgi:cobalt-zinc-cadmium efflux system protein